MDNPFKFGSIVNDPFFTNRKEEMVKVREVLNSPNHLVVISPRRYGKSSLVFKVVEEEKRPVIALDMQLITSVEDLAAQLLKRIYKVFPFEKVRQYVKQFKVIPSISVNPLTNAVDVSFNPGSQASPVIEDVLQLFEQLSKEKNRLIVVFDEFQEINHIDPHLLHWFRSILQHHKKVNYIFLGSQESLIREIFEKKSSPFYHFALIMPLKKIPREDFLAYLTERFKKVTNESQMLVSKILDLTSCHPFYTQQMAFVCWNRFSNEEDPKEVFQLAKDDILNMHDIDYERIWANFNQTDKKLLIGLSVQESARLSAQFINQNNLGPSSTAYSSLKRLMGNGYVVKQEEYYEIDDPFFRQWIRNKREG